MILEAYYKYVPSPPRVVWKDGSKRALFIPPILSLLSAAAVANAAPMRVGQRALQARPRGGRGGGEDGGGGGQVPASAPHGSKKFLRMDNAYLCT